MNYISDNRKLIIMKLQLMHLVIKIEIMIIIINHAVSIIVDIIATGTITAEIIGIMVIISKNNKCVSILIKNKGRNYLLLNLAKKKSKLIILNKENTEYVLKLY